MLKSNRLYKSEESVMNRSKKLAITLAVLAALGGSVYVQPEQAFGAHIFCLPFLQFKYYK